MRIYSINNVQSSNNCAFGARILSESAMELYKDIKQKVLETKLFKLFFKNLKIKA